MTDVGSTSVVTPLAALGDVRVRAEHCEIAASVIIPSFNGAHRLVTLMTALSRQDMALPWEAIVVIDGSEDDSEEILSAYFELPVRLIVFPDNRGVSAALNAGFAAALGNVLIRCDDDLEPRSDFVRRHVEHHEHQAHVGIIGLCTDILPDTPYALAYGRDANARLHSDAMMTPSSEQWRYWAANCSVTRADLELVGPYNTDYRAYGWEDVEWGYRLAKSGVSCQIFEDVEVKHTAAATSTAIRALRSFESGRAKAHFERDFELAGGASPGRPDWKASAWRCLVGIYSIPLNERRIHHLGAECDRVLNHLPARMATILVALNVEASGRAGYRSKVRESRGPRRRHRKF